MSSAVQLYYWKVTFEDGYVLSEFDEEGNEIHHISFTPKSCTKKTENGVIIIPNSNIFADLEKKHGRVVQIGWYPFSTSLAMKAMGKQDNLRIATYPNLKEIVQEVTPAYHATTFVKTAEIKYGIKQGGKKIESIPIDTLVSKLHLTIVPREGGEPITSTFNLRYS
jgi:hypothetical protein